MPCVFMFLCRIFARLVRGYGNIRSVDERYCTHMLIYLNKLFSYRFYLFFYQCFLIDSGPDHFLIRQDQSLINVTRPLLIGLRKDIDLSEWYGVISL